MLLIGGVGRGTVGVEGRKHKMNGRSSPWGAFSACYSSVCRAVALVVVVDSAHVVLATATKAKPRCHKLPGGCEGVYEAHAS